MIKYKSDTVQVVFEEIPDEVTLAIEITNCPGHCVGCHSPWLREDIGEELTSDVLHDLIDKNKGITCVCFMGEGKDTVGLLNLAKMVEDMGLKAALYSGREHLGLEFFSVFSYVKVGPYIAEYGPLNKETTNQKLYEVHHKKEGNEVSFKFDDITYKFWKKD